MTRWIFPPAVDPVAARQMSDELGIARFAAEVLLRRGMGNMDDAREFLSPRLRALADPFLLPNMPAAVDRVLQAIDRREKVVLYGDYDVDGVTSLAFLNWTLKAFGLESACFLPLRADEGYGLSAEGLARCIATHAPQLLIAVDCGTSSIAEISQLRAQGIDTIVLDHHECGPTLPDCVALVNPKLGSDFRYLCSVGIVFKLAHALLKRRPSDSFDLRDALDLVALGTVADLAPLRGENRIFACRGLAQLAHSKWVGLRALIEISGLSAPFTTGNIGFGLAPRLNAAGRLGTAQDALELLLTSDPARARILATNLDLQNRERRAVEDAVFLDAEAQLATNFVAARDAAIIVGSRNWHPGVVGIVASRLQKRYHRPTLVVGFDELGWGKGSGRSIPGLSLVEVLARCRQHLEKHGGHEMAAGLTVREESFADFRAAFAQCAREILNEESLQPRLHLDAELTLGEINYELLDQHETLQPFGMGHPQPLFAARAVTLAGQPRVMKEKHLAVILRQGRDEYRAVWFGAASETLPRPPWDVAFQIERNEWQGTVSPQIHIRAVRASQAG